MKKIIFLFTIITMLCYTQVFGQELKINNNTKDEYDFNTLINSATDTYTKYVAISLLAIHQEPDNESTILGYLDINMEVEVICELNGWSCIALDNGMHVYVYSECLSSTPILNRWNIILTQEELDMLYRIVMLEAGGECAEGQQAVTEVILNRIIDTDFPNILVDVLSQKNQFTPYKYINSSRAFPTSEVIINVNKVLNGETSILPFSTVYFSRKAQNERKQCQIGMHVFCNK